MNVVVVVALIVCYECKYEWDELWVGSQWKWIDRRKEEREKKREKRNKRKTDMNINEKVDKTVICKEVSLTNI